MSTSIDAHRRPSLWSYLSFTSTPRRRSVSLPTRANLDDPYEKANRKNQGAFANGPASIVDSIKDAWMTQSQRSRSLKIGGLIGIIVFLLFLFTPSERKGVRDFVGEHVPSRGGPTVVDSPLGPTKCIKSYSSGKPLIQYALMIDAGSTGSRIHIYRFNNCGPTPELEHETFKMTEKKAGGSGLSSYKSDIEGAAKSLDMLMDTAMETVPEKLRSCTPLDVKATAGLRILDKEMPGMSEQILEAVRNRLETVYPFPVVSKENGGVKIMDGKDEGVYAWITTNYLLGKIGGPDKTPTAAIFDLGGGSTQIVFQPTFKSPSKGMPETLAPGDHKYDLRFGGRTFELYQHSHLGYGLMAAREAIHRVVLEAIRADVQTVDPDWFQKPVSSPCIAPGMSKLVDVTLDGAKYSVNMTGPAIGSPAQCRGLAEKILRKDASCDLAPCSFGGVHQPSLEKTFAREDVYVFSYFYDRTQPLGMPESFTIRELRDLTQEVCKGEKSWGVFEGVEGALEELRDRPEYCLDLNFMVALLHTGYEMPADREVRIAKKINGNELGWCLGASLPLLDQGSGWKCRVKEV